MSDQQQELSTPPTTSSTTTTTRDKSKNDEDSPNSFLDALMQLPGEELTSVLMAYNASWEEEDDEEEGEEQNDEEENETRNENDDDQEQVTATTSNNNNKNVTFDLGKTEFTEFSTTEFDAAQANAENFFNTHNTDFLEAAAKKFESFEYEIIEEIQKQESDSSSTTTVMSQNNNNEEQQQQEQLQDDEEEDEGMMMGQRSKSIFDSFTRTCSDIGADSDDWILEKISLSRKVARSLVPNHDEDDYEYDDQDFDEYDDQVSSKQLTRKLQGSKRVVQFLCHWKYYDEPTWETRATLEKLGFADDVIKFEKDELEKIRERQNAARLVGGKALHAIEKFGLYSARSAYRMTVFEQIFPDWKDFIVQGCSDANLIVKGVANIAPAFAAAEFLRHWKACRDNGEVKTPIRVFHGTRAHIVPAICKNSLAVPGSRGCTMINAAAFGRGIYTSKYASTPSCYTDSHCLMFCCVALVGKQYETVARDSSKRQPPRHFVIVRENHLIVPVWLIHFARPPHNYYSRRLNDTAKEKTRNEMKQVFHHYGTWQELVLAASNGNQTLANSESTVQEYIPQNRPEDMAHLDPRMSKKKNSGNKGLRKFIAARVGSKFIEHKSTRMMRQLPKAMKDMVMEAWKKDKKVVVNDKNK